MPRRASVTEATRGPPVVAVPSATASAQPSMAARAPGASRSSAMRWRMAASTATPVRGWSGTDAAATNRAGPGAGPDAVDLEAVDLDASGPVAARAPAADGAGLDGAGL